MWPVFLRVGSVELVFTPPIIVTPITNPISYANNTTLTSHLGTHILNAYFGGALYACDIEHT